MRIRLFFHIFILLLLVESSISQQFLKKAIQLSIQEEIVEIVAVNSTTFAVRTQNEVILLDGPNFKLRHSTFKIPSGKVKISKHGISSLEESGSYMQFQAFDQNTTMMEDGLSTQMLVTSKYALFGKNTVFLPTIVKLDLKTLKKETFSYQNAGTVGFASYANLADLKNGEIAYIGSNFDLLLLDNETFEVMHQITPNQSYQTRGLSFYYNQEKNESNYLLLGVQAFELKKNNQGEYYLEERFSSLGYHYAQIVQTSINSGVMIPTCGINYLDNFKSIVHVSYDMEYFLQGRQGIAISNDQSFFAARNSQGQFEFYRIDEDYRVKLFHSLNATFNDLKKGKISSDDKNLFVSMSDSKDKHQIAKIDIKEGEFYFITDQFGNSYNQFDFALFHARYNRFVTLEFRGTSYYLQLRSVDNLSFIDEYKLSFDFQIAQYKLIGGNDWNLTFGLALRASPYVFNLENDTKLYMFKAEGDKIVSLNITANVSSNTLQSCLNYVITYKARFPLIRFLHISNLSLAFSINSQTQGQVEIYFEKNTLVMGYYKQFSRKHKVFDLSDSRKTVGTFFIDSLLFDRKMIFVLAQKGLFFMSPTTRSFNKAFTNKFFNISSPIIKQIVSMNPNSRYCPSASYYIPPQSISVYNSEKSPECNFVFYVDYEIGQVHMKFPQILKYSECDKTLEKHNIIEYGDHDVYAAKFISSDKKYVLILVNPWPIYEFLLEIRPIDSMEKIIFHKVFQFYAPYYRNVNGCNADLINDNMIIFQTPDFITVYFIEPKEYAEEHQMKNITLFDVNDRKVVALAGPALDDSSVTKVVVKAIAAKENMLAVEFNSEAIIIALSPKQEFVAVYSSDSRLRIWSIVSKSVVLVTVVEKATQIKFEDEESLIFESKEIITTLSFMSKSYQGSLKRNIDEIEVLQQ